jgi:hypothetical protein
MRVLQNLRSSFLSQVTTATMQAYECWYLWRSDCRNTPIYAQKTSHTLPTCGISLESLTLPTPEAAHFVELILLYPYVLLEIRGECLVSPGRSTAALPKLFRRRSILGFGKSDKSPDQWNGYIKITWRTRFFFFISHRMASLNILSNVIQVSSLICSQADYGSFGLIIIIL